MSFHNSCENIWIDVYEDCTVLLATSNAGDEYQDQEMQIVLDEHIGNGDGYFVRGDSNFTETAQDIKLEFRDDSPWLSAALLEVGGVERERQGINLADHIQYKAGQLAWIDQE